MKCVCETTCQVRVNGRITFVKEGEVFEFDKCPRNFRPVAGENINFLTASEEELLEANWKFSDAAKAIFEAYKVKLKQAEKSDVVKQILDARYRAVK